MATKKTGARKPAQPKDESIADRVVDSGSDLGHAVSEGAHDLAEGIHDTVADGLGHLLHRDKPAPKKPSGTSQNV